MNGKALIITGSTGIGAAAVRLAAGRGARVVIATQDEISGFELAAETGPSAGRAISRGPSRQAAS